MGLIRSNAQAIAANSDNIVATNAGIHELKESVVLLTASTDDSAGKTFAVEDMAKVNEQRFEALLAETRADRAETARRFDEQMTETAAQREILQRLLRELRSTNGEVKQLLLRQSNRLHRYATA